jgi:hypothetical protein
MTQKNFFGILSVLVLGCGASAARAEGLRLQDLEVSQENKMSYEEFQRLAAARPNTHTFGGGTTTAGNYPSTVTAANYPDTITAANYPDTVTAGNYPNTVTAGNYPFIVGDVANDELPAPQLAQ